MDYNKIYEQLINKACSENRKKYNGIYYERHHIVMKSMGGTNEQSNLVLLTAREHFIAHRLLYEIHKNAATAHSLWRLCNKKSVKFVSSRAYEMSRKIHAGICASKFKGNGNPFYGKTHSNKIKKQIKNKQSYIIIEYDLIGNKLDEHIGLNDASEKSGCHITTISMCCKKKTHFQTKGKTFRYKDDPFDYVPFNKHIQKTSKPVLKYGENGNIIERYDSIEKAAIDNSLIGSNLLKHLKHNKKYIQPIFVTKIINHKEVSLGYYFCFENNLGEKINKEYKYYAANKGITGVYGKPVIQKDKLGNFVSEYISIAEASKKIGIAGGNISNCCRKSPKHKTAGGFIWEYKIS